MQSSLDLMVRVEERASAQLPPVKVDPYVVVWFEEPFGSETFMLTTIFATLALSQAGIGSPFPEVTLQNMDGKPIRLSHFRGKKVVLFTWASW